MKKEYVLGMVIEQLPSDVDKPYSYLHETGFLRSLQVEDFIPEMASRHQHTYLINILENPVNGDGTINVYRALDNHPMTLPIISFDIVYFGNTGQKMYVEPHFNSLESNMEKICELLDILSSYDIKISNPKDTMVKFAAKDYLLELQEAGLPVSKGGHLVRLNNMEDFMALKEISKQLGVEYIIKPLISERGNGLKILSSLDASAIKELLHKFVETKFPIDNTTYSLIMNRQGLIAQPYNQDYITHGEKKLFYVHDDITFSRIHFTSNEKVKSNSKDLKFRNFQQKLAYTPTLDEVALVHKVAAHLREQEIPFDYFRLDLVGDGTQGNIFINELELFNPCSSGGHNKLNPKISNPDYPIESTQKHYRNLFRAFEKHVHKEHILVLEQRGYQS